MRYCDCKMSPDSTLLALQLSLKSILLYQYRPTRLPLAIAYYYHCVRPSVRQLSW